MRILPIMLALCVLIPAFPSFSHAQVDGRKQGGGEFDVRYLYQWTDGKGVLHITDGLEKVPQKYRDKAVRLEQRKKDEDQEPSQMQQGAPSAPNQEDADLELDKKEFWQRRMKQARQHLADAEQDKRDLEQRKKALLESAASARTGHLPDQATLDRLDAEIKQAQDEIDRARNEVEVEVPDAARKAGALPGWLRE